MSSALRTAGPPHSQTAAARRSCTLVGPTAAAFCRRQCGARRRDHATRKCGFRSGETYRRLFRLVGDLYDTSGGPVGSSSGASQTPARRENPVPTRRPFCTRRVSGDAAMTSRWTPSTRRQTITKKNRELPYARRPHLRRSSFAESFIQFRGGLLVELRLVVHALQDRDDVRLEHHPGHHNFIEDVVDLVRVKN